MTERTSFANLLGRLYLTYLALLPAAGTLVVYLVYDVRPNGLLFLLVGTAGVGIYLAVTASYTRLGDSSWKPVLLLFDGPVWATLAGAAAGPLTVLANDVLIDVAGILLGTLVLSVVSPKPTRQQRIGSIAATGIPLLGVAWLAWACAGDGVAMRSVVIATLGLLQAALSHFFVIREDRVQRPAQWLILVGIITWVICFIVGSAVTDPGS
jgi:hypothetical protein